MNDKKLDLPKDFFKQFKRKEDFQGFFQLLFKQGVEADYSQLGNFNYYS
jgi:hypothetical protein